MIDKQTFMAKVAGEDLHVCRLTPQGAGNQGPTLVFLHEALGSVAQWRDFPAELVAECAMPGLLYDRCGFGLSQPLARPRGLDYMAREVSCLKDFLDVCCVENVVLVGHSDGATLALLFAAAFPDRVVAVVSEAAHLFVEEETLAGIRTVVKRWQDDELRMRLERYHGPKTQQVFHAWAETWLDPSFRDWNIEGDVSRVACPVLAIQGEDDEFGTVRQIDAICALVKGPSTRRLISSCGHVPHHQARTEVLDEMSTFIRNIGSGRQVAAGMKG